MVPSEFLPERFSCRRGCLVTGRHSRGRPTHPDLDCAFVRFFLTGDHLRNSVVLPAPFGPFAPTMPQVSNLNVRSSIRRLSQALWSDRQDGRVLTGAFSGGIGGLCDILLAFESSAFFVALVSAPWIPLRASAAIDLRIAVD